MKNNNFSKRFIGINELAQYLGISPKTLREWVNMRKIPFYKYCRLIKFDLNKIEDWLNQSEIEPLN